MAMLFDSSTSMCITGSSGALIAWSAVGGTSISVVDDTTPLSSAIPNSLQVVVPQSSSGSVGVANAGYTGKQRRFFALS